MPDAKPLPSPRVVIVGAGPAGTRAAAALVAAGLRPVIIDEAPNSGGQIYRRPPDGLARSGKDLYGFEAPKARRLHERFDSLRGNLDHRPQTLVWGAENRHLLLSGPQGLSRLPFDAVILATGAVDRIVPVPGWTQPGVYSLGGAQVVLKHQACLIGQRLIFVGTGPLLYLVAYQYAKAGARVAAVLDCAHRGDKALALPTLAANAPMLAKGLYYAGWLRAHRIPVHEGAVAERIEAGAGNELTVTWRSARGAVRRTAGDAVALGYGLKPETQLADILGCSHKFDADSRLWLLDVDGEGRTSIAGVYAAGDGAGIRGADAAETAGELAALAVLADFGRPIDERRRVRLHRRLACFDRFRRGLETAFAYPAERAAATPDETVVCRCEGVTAGDLRAATVDWGVRDMNRLKAVSRCGMGRCQGRLCGPPAAEILAVATGRDVADVGRLRGQPPIKPLTVPAPSSESREAAE